MPEENNKDQNAQVPPADGSSNKPVTPPADISEAGQVRKETVPPVQDDKTKAAQKPATKKLSTQIGKEVSKPKNTSRFLMITGLSLAGLFVLFVVLMVLMIAGGGGESPILSALGINDAGIKSFLLLTINISFGLLGFIFFVLGVVGVFRLLFAKKDDKDAKSKGIRMLILGIIPLVIIMMIWTVLFGFINRIDVSSKKIKAEILVVNPKEVDKLSAPVEVTFSSENVIKSLKNSGLQVTGAKWDFEGKGNFDTTVTSDFEMSYLYNNKGNYSVGLEVTVNGEEKPRQYFYTLSIPDALFSAEPTSGTAPLTVTFDTTALIPKGAKVQSIDWDFDADGTYDESGNDKLHVTYKYEKIGKYNAHLRIVDDKNLVNNYYREIEISTSAEPLLSAVIDATPSLKGQIPLQVRFDAQKSTSLKGSIIKYDWDYGDGSQIQSGRSVSKIFEKPGTYNVTLTVTEDSGATNSATVVVVADSVSSVPVANFTTLPVSDGVKLSGEIPFKVDFDASKSTDEDKDIVEYSWDFGDKSPVQTGQKVTYTYESAGIYNVLLTVTDSEKQKSTSKLDIEVTQPGVKAVIKASPEEGTAPLTVNFDGSSSTTFEGNIVSYEWDFGDKTPKTITSAQISHKYDSVGNYEVKLKVTTNKNETGETSKIIYVREIPLHACFTPSRRNGDAPLAVTFDTKCSTGTVALFSWDFGDGTTSDDRKPTHTFENVGTYNVKLEVTDDKNNVNTYSDVIVVTGQLK